MRVTWPAAANPVLRTTDFTGQLALAADAAHQDVVGVAQMTDAQRQALRVCKLSPGVRERIHIVADFPDIVQTVRPIRGLEGEDVAQRGLSSFDLRGDDRLLPNEAVEEPVSARRHRPSHGKTGQFGLRGDKKLGYRVVSRQRRIDPEAVGAERTRTPPLRGC